MDDIARGDLVGDNSDEPRIDADQAARMLVGSCSLEQTESVLALTQSKDRQRVIRRAARLRDHEQQRRARARWRDQPLPFKRSPR